MKKKLLLSLLMLCVVPAAFAHYHWKNGSYGWAAPAGKVRGGHAFGKNLYVCKAGFRGEQHPGYLVNGTCHIVVGNRGASVNNYQVLTGSGRFRWHEGKHGHIPSHAIPGGHRRGRTLYICKANYHGGTYTGELDGRDCNFAYRSDRRHESHYQVLIYS